MTFRLVSKTLHPILRVNHVCGYSTGISPVRMKVKTVLNLLQIKSIDFFWSSFESMSNYRKPNVVYARTDLGSSSLVFYLAALLSLQCMRTALFSHMLQRERGLSVLTVFILTEFREVQAPHGVSEVIPDFSYDDVLSFISETLSIVKSDTKGQSFSQAKSLRIDTQSQQKVHACLLADLELLLQCKDPGSFVRTALSLLDQAENFYDVPLRTILSADIVINTSMSESLDTGVRCLSAFGSHDYGMYLSSCSGTLPTQAVLDLYMVLVQDVSIQHGSDRAYYPFGVTTSSALALIDPTSLLVDKMSAIQTHVRDSGGTGSGAPSPSGGRQSTRRKGPKQKKGNSVSIPVSQGSDVVATGKATRNAEVKDSNPSELPTFENDKEMKRSMGS